MYRSISEELLVLTADEHGRLHRNEMTEALVGGAVLAELIVTGVVTVEGSTDASVVRATSLPEAARLGVAVDALSDDAVLTPELVRIVGWAAYDVEVERLLAAGTLVRERTRFLGLLPRDRLSLVEASASDAWRELRTSMEDADGIDRRGATIVALLDGVGALDEMIGSRAVPAVRPRFCGTSPAERVADLLGDISSVAGTASAAATAAAAATPSLR